MNPEKRAQFYAIVEQVAKTFIKIQNSVSPTNPIGKEEAVRLVCLRLDFTNFIKHIDEHGQIMMNKADGTFEPTRPKVPLLDCAKDYLRRVTELVLVIEKTL